MRMGNGEKSSLTKDVPGMKLEERDLVEEFSRAGGRGGQNVQKVETRVVLRHLPTGITVVAQEERFREANRLRQEDEWFKLWQIGNGGSVWQKRLKDRERGAGRRNEVDAQKGIWWREKESGR
ncbi:MAG: peptide chain release factor-like protein [Verrucomicrobia bacterium]|nr:peptide chain release factor-like protein [Verrucomicrobiota bacterium]